MPPPQRKRHRRPKGTGTVVKLSGNRTRPWVVKLGGKSLGTYATSSAAVKALDAYLVSALPPELENITFAQIYEQWSPNHFATITKKASTAFSRAFERAKSLHTRKMKSLKTADFQAVIDSMSDKSRSSCEKQRQLFSQMCKFAMQQDIIDKNYAEFLVLPKAPPIKDRVLTDEEISRIWTMVDDKRLGDTARIALGLIYTGMRISELLQLRRADCHMDKHCVVGGNKTAAGKGRTIPMHADVVPIFAAWWENSEGSEWLIPSERGNARDADGVRKSFNSLMTKLGIEGVTPHTCRHTAATRMAADHVPTDSIKRILGHTDYAFTADRYTATDPDALYADLNQVHRIR